MIRHHHQLLHNGDIAVTVAAGRLGQIVVILPLERRQAIQVLQALMDEVPAAVDHALSVAE